MNTQSTMRLLRERFAGLDEIAPDLLRGERRICGSPFGVFYFDFSESVTKKEFNLAEYMQERIATDYYKHEGSVQWNYYVFFVLKPASLQRLTTTRIADVEGDRTFARKYIRDAEALSTELASPLSDFLGVTEPSQDIASRWVGALNEAGLGSLADPSADYAPIIKRYLEKANGPGDITTKAFSPVSVDPGQFIQTLDLGTFRQHPHRRRFEFGRVNLIRGANGAGKTSLLEAIELCICGGNRRQGGSAPENTKLRVQFANQASMQNCPVATPKLYRDRDRSWYGGYYLQGNKLFENFSRFNFFDTDAAVTLSSESSGSEIQQAIDTLFLGEYATSIEERMRQSLERFRRYLLATQRELKVHRGTRGDTLDDLERLKAVTDTRESLFKDLKKRASECRWIKIPSRPTLNSLESLRESAAMEAERLSQVARRLRWISRLSVASLQKERLRLDHVRRDGVSLTKKLAALTRTLERDREAQAAILEELRVISRIKQYHEANGAIQLRGLTHKKASLRATLNRFRSAAALVKKARHSRIEFADATLPELIKARSDDITRRRRALNKHKAQLADVQARFDQIRTAVDQIRGLGRHFGEMHPEADACPLCGAYYDNLFEHLNSLPDVASPLGDIAVRVATAEEALSNSVSEMSSLQKLQEADELLRPGKDKPSRSARLVLSDLLRLPERSQSLEDDLEALISQEGQLRSLGFTESDLDSLFEVAVDELLLNKSKLEKPELIADLKDAKEKARRDFGLALKESEDEHKVILAKQRQLYSDGLGRGSFDDPEVEVERRVATLEDVLASISAARRTVEVKDDEEITNAWARLDAFSKAVARILDAFKRIEEKDALEKGLAARIAQAELSIARLEARESRARDADKLLRQLLGSEYKEAYLDDIHAKNHERLVTLFTRIHAPNEFMDVVFSGDVQLRRRSGEESSVSEISTGQRAALALSIFLSMNSSVSSRAPWLLFDDPVAHVDDLNILSFLDILRDLVLIGDRQVFFATASGRIADLFVRKFDFLGGDFREVRLTR